MFSFPWFPFWVGSIEGGSSLDSLFPKLSALDQRFILGHQELIGVPVGFKADSVAELRLAATSASRMILTSLASGWLVTSGVSLLKWLVLFPSYMTMDYNFV
jgi:hypothetical protein